VAPAKCRRHDIKAQVKHIFHHFRDDTRAVFTYAPVAGLWDNVIQVAAAVIKKLAPEGLCRNCELNNEVTPATLPAGDLADDIKEQTRGLCDACRTLQIEQSLDADARDSIR
jgi:hypothetical protein